jgi:hypothetical protein
MNYLPEGKNILTNFRNGENTMDFEGYCVKCKTKRPVKNAKVVTTSNGRKMAKGACPVCGTTVNKFLPKSA